MAGSRAVRNTSLAATTASSAQEWAEPIAERFEALLRPFLEEGETMPDTVLMQKLMGRLMTSCAQTLKEADRSCSSHGRDATLLRGDRNRASEALREELRRARFFLDQTLGKGSGAQYGIGKGLSYMAPLHLLRSGRHIAMVLDTCVGLEIKRTLPPAATLAEEVRRLCDELEATLDGLRPAEIGHGFSRGVKGQEMAKSEKLIRRSAGFLSGLYKLCDYEYLAKKVRPAFRRKARKKEEVAEPAAADPASPGRQAKRIKKRRAPSRRLAPKRREAGASKPVRRHRKGSGPAAQDLSAASRLFDPNEKILSLGSAGESRRRLKVARSLPSLRPKRS